jgi:hypothetical protein
MPLQLWYMVQVGVFVLCCNVLLLACWLQRKYVHEETLTIWVVPGQSVATQHARGIQDRTTRCIKVAVWDVYRTVRS